MRTSTICEQVRGALADDVVLSVLGFHDQNVGEQHTRGGRVMVTTWSTTWHGSDSALIGVVTIDVVGVSDQIRQVVLDRVAVVLGRLPVFGGPVRRVRRNATDPAEFTVLAVPHGAGRWDSIQG